MLSKCLNVFVDNVVSQGPVPRGGGANANGHAHGSGVRNGGPAERGQAFSVVAGGRADAAAPAAAPSREDVELQLALALSRSLADDEAEPGGMGQSSMQQRQRRTPLCGGRFLRSRRRKT